jgi:hypothetical protein
MSDITDHTEMLMCLAGHAHRHVWVNFMVDPAADETREENAIVQALRTFGMSCNPTPVRDQFGKLVTR